MLDISVNISGVKFDNPIILASGPMSNSRIGLQKAGKMGFGGIVTKSSTIIPSSGNPPPHLVIRQGYVINADGVRNQGYKAMAKDINGAKQSAVITPIIASVAGTSVAEFVIMSQEFEHQGASGIELNFVCPNRGKLVGQSREETIGRYWVETSGRCPAIIKGVKKALKIPVWVKFPFETVYKDHRIVREMEEEGADALVVTTSIPRAMALNLETGRPLLGNPRGAGAVGGFIMKPLGVNCVAELSRVVKIPVIASGGVFSGLDVIEYIMAGAQAVAVLTAFMQKVTVTKMLAEITDFMTQNGYSLLRDFRGITHKYLPGI
jgi:dihydroorotate dehydrogenase (NAD+) catalytic subunit